MYDYYDYDENISLYLRHRTQEPISLPVGSLADLLGDDGDYEVYDANTFEESYPS